MTTVLYMMTKSNSSPAGTHRAALTIDDTQSLSKLYEKNEDFRDVETDYEARESLNKKIHFYIGDITDFAVDAIVCSTQTDLSCVPYGMHKQVIRKAGSRYRDACVQVGHCREGEAFITQGYDLPAKYVIHTAGPTPDTTLDYEERKVCLRQSYVSCLQLLKNTQDIRSVAFPCIGCGGGGIQTEDAVSIAMTTIREWCETGDNITHVDYIILVMYDSNQWSEYYMELFKTFPYGKDLAGFDIETLNILDKVNVTRFIPQSATPSTILCFKYKKSATNYITRHFHSLVNKIHRHGNRSARQEHIERFKNCAIISVTNPYEYKIIIFNNSESLTLEIQMIFCTDNVDEFWETLSQEVHTLINDYLIRNLENVTRFKTYIRCNNSEMGDLDGMVCVQRMKSRMTNYTTIQCRHKKQTHTTHTVNINEMTRFWSFQDQEPFHSFHPQPAEHNEMSGDSEDSLSWPSLASLSSSSSGGNEEPKQDNVPRNTGEAGRQPVEHSDESKGNTISKFTKFVKNKFQVLTKPSKDGSETNLKSEHKEGATNMQTKCLLPQNLVDETEPSGQQMQTTGSRVHGGESTVAWQRSISSEPKATRSDSFDLQPRRNSFSEIGQYEREGNETDSLEAKGVKSLESDWSYSNDKTPLNDKTLLQIARLVGNRESQLGLELNLTYAHIQRIKTENPNDAVIQAFNIIREWKIKQRGNASLEKLMEAMANCSIDTSSLEIN